MKTKFLLTAILLFLCSVQIISAQNEKTIRGRIVNGKATYLPKPEYTEEAKNFCASGKVEVEVLINENGEVVSTEAVSGDKLLRDSAIEAAKRARFRQIADGTPVKMRGIVVYNYVSEKKCIEAGIVNKKAVKIPKPLVANLNHPKHFVIKQEQTVRVRIIIESWSGKVTGAITISGHPLLRAACESSARQTIFSPVNDVPNIPIKATLVYKFKPDGTIEF